jgi:hypothetical protein
MIRSRKHVESYRTFPCAPEGITALDLNDEMQRAEQDGAAYETHVIRLHDGGTEQSDAQLLYFPDAGRAGIAWGGDADWFDANSPTEAVEAWLHAHQHLVSERIDLSAFTSNNQDVDRIGVSSTKGMLWEISQALPDRFQAVKDADGLRVRISAEDAGTSRWAHVWVADTSPDGFHGYTYALMAATSATEHGFTDGSRRILESDADAFFQPSDVVQAVEDALNKAIGDATNTAAPVPA